MTSKMEKENNKLIAEFMELKEGKKYLSPPLEEPEAIGLGMYVSLDEMRYHASWDWLMPVIKKMADIRKDTHYRLYNTIDDAYKAVVEFIKEYNQNKDDEKS